MHKEESSHTELAGSPLPKGDEEKALEKLVLRKAWTRGKKSNNPGQCSCSLVWCVSLYANVHFEHVCFYVQVFLRVCRYVWFCACLQQVHAAVVQQVGCALWSLLQHLVLVDDLHSLIVDA